MALPGISESFNSVRVAETTTRSPWAVPRKIKASGVGAEPATQVFSAGAKLLAFTRTVPDPPLGAVNENLPSSSVYVVWFELAEARVTCAPETAAPVSSRTTPLIVICCAPAANASIRQTKIVWEK